MDEPKVIEALAERTLKPVKIGLNGFPGCFVTIPAGWWLVVERDWSETYWSPARFEHVFGNRKANSQQLQEAGF